MGGKPINVVKETEKWLNKNALFGKPGELVDSYIYKKIMNNIWSSFEIDVNQVDLITNLKTGDWIREFVKPLTTLDWTKKISYIIHWMLNKVGIKVSEK